MSPIPTYSIQSTKIKLAVGGFALQYKGCDSSNRFLISSIAIIVTCEGGDRRLGVHELLESGDGGEGLLHWSEIQSMVNHDHGHIMIL